MEPLYELASCYRAAQLFAHTAHHLTKGPTFFQDHEWFGSLYSTYKDAFDDLCEEALALGEKYSPVDIMRKVVAEVNTTFSDKTTDAYFNRLLSFEKDFQKRIADMMKDTKLADGTQNLIQGLATESSKRVYKMNARMG